MKIFKKIALPTDIPFINNKYTEWYYCIIFNTMQREMPDYTEKHHIIPDCFFIENRSKGQRPGWIAGDSNSPSNIVKLTPKEHFICHWLLTKMISGDPKKRMEKALAAMMWVGSKNNLRRLTAGQYSIAKQTLVLSMRGKKKSLDSIMKTANANRGRKLSGEHKDKISTAMKQINKDRIENKTHNFLKQNLSDKPREYREMPKIRNAQNKLVENGRHIFQQDTHKERVKEFQRQRVADGRHHLLGKQPIITCPHCQKSGGKCNMLRYHFDNCKVLKNSD